MSFEDSLKLCAHRATRIIMPSRYAQGYFLATFIFLVLCIIFFGLRDNAIMFYTGEFYFDLALAAFGGFVVGYIVEIVQIYNQTRHIRKLLFFVNPLKEFYVVTADRSIDMNALSTTNQDIYSSLVKVGENVQKVFDAQNSLNSVDRNIRLLRNLLSAQQNANKDVVDRYHDTGPGESIAIGLLYSAYLSALGGDRSRIHILSPECGFDQCTLGYAEARIVLGGPNFNKLTAQLLNNDIYYDVQTDPSTPTLVTYGMRYPAKHPIKDDFGLILKQGNLLHLSGCRTWGVAGAAECVLSESLAEKLVNQMREKCIDPKKEDYFAVVRCTVPNARTLDYQIENVTIEIVNRLRQSESQPARPPRRAKGGA